MKKRFMLLILCILVFLYGCSTENVNEGSLKYEEAKKMVVDILKTDDGKKAMKDLLNDEQFRQELVLDHATVTEAIEKTLVSEKGREFWKKSFEDAKFAETFAKSMQKETEKLMKGLMNDPEYRGMMIEVLHDPELEKELSDLLKSKEYRQHLQKIITETFESPLFQAKLQDIIIKSAKEIQTKTDDKGDQSESSS